MSKKRKPIMYPEFPIYFGEEPYLRKLESVFLQYKEWIRENSKKENNLHTKVNDLCNSIINFVRQYLDGDILNAYSEFYQYLENKCFKDEHRNLFEDLIRKFNWKEQPPTPGSSEDIRNPQVFYRMRRESCTKDEMWHIPFDKIERCSTERWSNPGYPCLYMGFTAKVCKLELDTQTGTIAKFRLTKDLNNIIDLTLDGFGAEMDDKFKLAWPILAACYCVYVQTPRIPDDTSRKFKVEYIVPQFIALYLKKKGYRGLVHYTVRNPNLNPKTNDWKNLVLFTNNKRCDANQLDEDIVNQFNIELIQNNANK